jgi:hypothetical protein
MMDKHEEYRKTRAGFIEYAKEFYGQNGIYAEFFAQNRPTHADFSAAYTDLLALRRKQGIDFDGDTFDREVLRDLLFVRMGILTPEQTEYIVEA